MRKYPVLLALAVVLASAGLVACQDLFTTSLASSLARESLPIPPTLTTEQAADLAAQAKANDDAKLAGALVSSLVDQIETTTDPEEKAKLEATAAGAAVTASGASSTVTEAISSLSSGTEMSADEAEALIDKLKAGATEDVVTALSYLDPATGIDSATSGLSATEYLVAAVVIASSVTIPEDGSSLSAADQAKLESASRILAEAEKLSGDDPDTAALIASLTGSLGDFDL
jgi:hypothetical protein